MMEKRVASVLEEILDLKPRTLHGSTPISTLNLDSLDMVSLIAEIDAVFGVTISPVQIADCERIDDLEALVKPGKSAHSSAA